VVQKCVLDELGSRKQKLAERLMQLKTESEEIWKSMETVEKTLGDMVAANDYDTTRYFVEEDRAALRDNEGTLQKQKSDRRETEDFYMNVSLKIL
jgi:SLIT-ROBO Rho GTPase activating protein